MLVLASTIGLKLGVMNNPRGNELKLIKNEYEVYKKK
jgi:hypothetical protein|tara:strand:+ start:150 stop:260 length:111 start_codon:yes stop_codon:yes gene_type:complete